MQKAKYVDAGSRIRTAYEFKIGAHLMKRTVSLSEVARYGWLYGRQTQETCKTGQAKIYTILETIFKHSSMFIINPRLKNNCAQKFMKSIPLESSFNVHHQSKLILT